MPERPTGVTRAYVGELKKLGIHKISRTTVYNILRDHGHDPSPHRTEGTWDAFLKRHGKTLWACDIVTKRVWTTGGLRYARVLIFINVLTRRVWASPSTFHSNSNWCAEQAATFVNHLQGDPNAPTVVIRDNDRNYGSLFDHELKLRGVHGHAITPVSPNLNAYAERFIQTLQQECLDHFVTFGKRHLDYLVREFVDYYNTQRPHQSLGNLPLRGEWPARASPLCESQIVCEERLGGLILHYSRRAA